MPTAPKIVDVWTECPPEWAARECDCTGPGSACGKPFCWWCPPNAVRNGIAAGGIAGLTTAMFSIRNKQGDPLVRSILVGGLIGLAAWYFFSGRWWV